MSTSTRLSDQARLLSRVNGWFAHLNADRPGHPAYGGGLQRCVQTQAPRRTHDTPPAEGFGHACVLIEICGVSKKEIVF